MAIPAGLHKRCVLITACCTALMLTCFYVSMNVRIVDTKVKEAKPSSLSNRLKSLFLNKGQIHNRSLIEHETVMRKEMHQKTRIGILIPSTTRKLTNPELSNLSIVATCIPSINKTMEAQYDYTIYIGIDAGDYLEYQIEELRNISFCIKPVVVKEGDFVKAVNTIAKQAYDDGMDYLVRINDDTIFETVNWTSLGIATLKLFDPPNVGVVGPTCHEGNTDILTHDMVHRTHLDIFNNYYPSEFKNVWSDDWITHVYEPDCSIKLPSWVVKHTIRVDSRYDVDFSIQRHLVPLENEGKLIIKTFINILLHNQRNVNGTQEKESITRNRF